MTNKWQDYKFPEWGKQKMGDYAQPVANTWKPGRQKDTGYPDEGIDMNDIMVKGRYPTGTKKKKLMDIRGYGAATKGRKFHPDED
jgi:hypothetical protein